LACDNPNAGLEQCLARPSVAYMRFKGGDCSQSNNKQPLRFSCMDTNGGPPTAPGSIVNIRVTDNLGQGIVYFDGPVAVGDIYPLSNGGQPFQSDQLITITTPDRSTVLQVVQFQTSCMNNLGLKDTFGASQLVGYFNEVQGNVTCAQTFDFSFDIGVPPGGVAPGNNVSLTGLIAMTNFAGQINLTDQVAGVELGPGEQATVTLSGAVDLSVRRNYMLMVTVQGVEVPNGALCEAMDNLMFDAGYLANSPSRTPTIFPPSKKKSKVKKISKKISKKKKGPMPPTVPTGPTVPKGMATTPTGPTGMGGMGIATGMGGMGIATGPTGVGGTIPTGMGGMGTTAKL
jgi:hypothetical protein